ncbi:MAG: hypothetical protein Q8K68_03755 [Nitrospirota bacterium]|nr:hypothetical protein [Nitrospirota bacterium]
MPHFGLMSTKESFDNTEGALLRARLHLRGGRRRLVQGKVAAGIVTLYDALIFGLRFYFMIPEHRSQLDPDEYLDLTDEKAMIRALRNAGIVDRTFDLNEFDKLVERAAWDEMADYDYGPMLSSFESLMTVLEVMPFDETTLPEENTSTF